MTGLSEPSVKINELDVIRWENNTQTDRKLWTLLSALYCVMGKYELIAKLIIELFFNYIQSEIHVEWSLIMLVIIFLSHEYP